MRKKILCDVDGPLSRGFFDLACQYLREEGVRDARTNMISQWDIFRSFNASAEVEKIVRSRLCLPGRAQYFRPNEGAKEFLSDVRSFADVYAVTAPLDDAPTWSYDREFWLQHQLGFKPEEIISARDKRLIRGDVFIDDKFANLDMWQKENPNGLAIMWLEPHNRSVSSLWPGPKVRDYEGLMAKLAMFRGM